MVELWKTAWAVVTSTSLPLIERVGIGMMLASPVFLAGALVLHYVARGPRRAVWNAMAQRNGWTSTREGRLAGSAGSIAWSFGPDGTDLDDVAFVARGVDPGATVLVGPRAAYERVPGLSAGGWTLGALLDVGTSAWMRAPGLMGVDVGSPEFQRQFVVLVTRPADARRAITPEVERWWLREGAPGFAPGELDVSITQGTVRVRLPRHLLDPEASARLVRIGLSLVDSLADPTGPG